MNASEEDCVSPRLHGRKAARNEDSETKLLQEVSDTSIEQRSSYLLSWQHMAFDEQGNNCFQAALSHPTERIRTNPKLINHKKYKPFN